MRFLILTLLIGCSHYSKADNIVAGTFITANVIDWMQTNEAIRCGDYREANPIIGSCGENVPTYIYFPVTTTAILIGTYLLPRDWHSPVLGVITGIQVHNVYGNYKVMH